VRRGEKACPVVFWKWLDLQDKPTGETERVPLLRYYSLFNVAQCDGIPADRIPAEDSKREHNPIARAESIVATMPKRPEIRHGLNQAFYSPAQDFVGMPAPEQFKTAEAYYCCVFHELTHSTGHETRLNRKGVSGTDGQWSAFGSDPYAKEELVATMGEAYLCAKAGIIKRTITNSASYISGWLERLRKDNRLIIQAAAQAQHAADYILNRKAIVPEEPAEAHN
jgi:antirestriction protein ArdC